MTEFSLQAAEVILLDIEGTTTPVDFVFGVLFPFAQTHVEDFLRSQGHNPEVQTDLELLRKEYETDVAQGLAVPEWTNSAIPYFHDLIENDRKSTGLKSLQGKIWEQGYRNGTLRSQIFSDVKPAFERWTEAGKRLFIYSSGSVQAQKLLFEYSEAGDLTSFLSGYFDTTVGAKTSEQSYIKIAQAIGTASTNILFISDVATELKAAESTGMQALFSLRPGNHPTNSEAFNAIQSFDQIKPIL